MACSSPAGMRGFFISVRVANDMHKLETRNNPPRSERIAASFSLERLRSRFLCLLQQMFRIVTQVLINLCQLTWIFMSHQNRDRQSINTTLQCIRGPRMPQGVQRIFWSSFLSHLIRQFAFGFMPQFRFSSWR
jgi:hypothetical protein